MRINDRGQVLVTFIILLPIFLFIFAVIIDYGLLCIEKRKITNNVREALTYYENNIDDYDIKDKTKQLLQKNLDNVEIDIIESDYDIQITVKSNYKSLYNTLTNNNLIINKTKEKEV